MHVFTRGEQNRRLAEELEVDSVGAAADPSPEPLDGAILFAPAGTPRSIIDKLNKALNEVLCNEEVIRRIESHGASVETSTPPQLHALVAAELAKWKEVVRNANFAAA